MVGSSVSQMDISIDSDSARVDESFITEKGTKKIGVHTNDNNNNNMLRHFRLHDILYSNITPSLQRIYFHADDSSPSTSTY